MAEAFGVAGHRGGDRRTDLALYRAAHDVARCLLDMAETGGAIFDFDLDARSPRQCWTAAVRYDLDERGGGYVLLSPMAYRTEEAACLALAADVAQSLNALLHAGITVAVMVAPTCRMRISGPLLVGKAADGSWAIEGQGVRAPLPIIGALMR